MVHVPSIINTPNMAFFFRRDERKNNFFCSLGSYQLGRGFYWRGGTLLKTNFLRQNIVEASSNFDSSKSNRAEISKIKNCSFGFSKNSKNPEMAQIETKIDE